MSMATERAHDYCTVQFTTGQCRAKGQWGEEGEDEGRRGRCRGGSIKTLEFTVERLSVSVNVCVVVIDCVVQLDTRGV